MDRPSTQPLPKLDKPPEAKQHEFVLPKITTEETEKQPTDGREFYFSNIVIESNTVLPEALLHEITNKYENRKITIVDIEELRQKITRYYIDEGYINSGAIIPDDAIKDNKLYVKVIEGRLDAIQINGLGRLHESYVKNRLQDDPDEPLNIKELQDRFQVLLSDPLISEMKGRLLPGSKSGQSLLDLEVSRAQPYSLTLFSDNYRPPSIGGEAFGLSGRVFNLTGYGDAVDFTFINSEGSEHYAGGFTMPLDKGTSVFFHFDEGDSSVVTKPINKLKIESRIHSLESGINHAIVNNVNQQFNLGITLAVRKNETTLGGIPFSFVPGEPSGQNQATVWRINQYVMQRWESQALAFRSTFSVGMNALGATPKTSDDFPSSEFFSWLGQVQYAQRIFDGGSQIVLRGNAQFSDSPLLPLERISIGGVGTVRGYRENHLVTDNGFNLTAEYHRPIITGEDAKYSLAMIPFIDYGEAWNNSSIEKNTQRHLLSIGLGLSWHYTPVSLDLFYGYAINRPNPRIHEDIQDEAIHFQVKVDAL